MNFFKEPSSRLYLPQIRKTEQSNGRTVISRLYNAGPMRFGGALEFDAGNDYVTVSNDASINFDQNDSFSVRARFKFENPGDRWSVLHKSSTSNSYGISFTGSSGSSLSAGVRGSSNLTNITKTLNENQIYDVVLTYDDGDVKIYIDGVLEFSEIHPDDDFQNNDPWQIGGTNGLLGNAGSAEGIIFAAELWNKALTQAEIQANMFKRLKGNENGLVGYWPLGDNANDLTANGNHGTLQGSPQFVSPSHPVFTGDDRPEYHKTLEGVEQVCVEKESTNEFTRSNEFAHSDWAKTSTGSGLAPVVTAYVETILGLSFSRVVFDLDGNTTSSDRSILRQSSVGETETEFTMSFWIKSNDGNTYQMRWHRSGGDFSNLIVTPELQRHELTATSGSSGNHGIELRGHTSDGYADILISSGQFEESPYPTLYIPTEGTTVTRPAPSPVIEDALPETGSIGLAVDMVRDGEGTRRIWDTGVDTNTARSILQITTSNHIQTWLYGMEGGRINEPNPFAWAAYTRKDIAAITSWDADNIYLWLCDMDGNLYGYSNEHDINTDTDRDITLGADPGGGAISSTRFMSIKSTTEIIDTAEKAKQAIEHLTTGNLNLKARDIKLQN